MVATILRRYSPADARALVERSFGSYLNSPEAQRQREVLQQAATSSSSSKTTTTSSSVNTDEDGSEDGGSGVKIVGKGDGRSGSSSSGSGSMSASPPTEGLSEQEAMAWQVSTLAAKLEAMTAVLQGFDLSEVRSDDSSFRVIVPSSCFIVHLFLPFLIFVQFLSRAFLARRGSVTTSWFRIHSFLSFR